MTWTSSPELPHLRLFHFHISPWLSVYSSSSGYPLVVFLSANCFVFPYEHLALDCPGLFSLQPYVVGFFSSEYLALYCPIPFSPRSAVVPRVSHLMLPDSSEFLNWNSPVPFLLCQLGFFFSAWFITPSLLALASFSTFWASLLTFWTTLFG